MNTLESQPGMIIPYERLSETALRGLIEEYVTRDGTDTGYTAGSLEASIAQVMRQLRAGTATIVYDEKTGSCNIISRDMLSRLSTGR